jgi:hypothetical protein
MFNTTKILLSAALVVSTTFTASAANKPRPTHVHGPATYDIAPGFSTLSRTRIRDYMTDPIMVPRRFEQMTSISIGLRVDNASFEKRSIKQCGC